MIAYVDSSVLLRIVLEQPGQLRDIGQEDELLTSTLTQVECLRALDNATLRGAMSVDESEVRRAAAFDKLRNLLRVYPSLSVLERAEGAFPSPVAALDAIHLATALVWRQRHGRALLFATHDRQQARAARALGFAVIGA